MFVRQMKSSLILLMKGFIVVNRDSVGSYHISHLHDLCFEVVDVFIVLFNSNVGLPVLFL